MMNTKANSLTVDTTGHLYDEFLHLLFLYDHREVSVLTNELSEESDQFRFLRVSCVTNLKGSVGLIMVKVSPMWILIPLDLSSDLHTASSFHSFSRPTPLLPPSLVLLSPCSV